MGPNGQLFATVYDWGGAHTVARIDPVEGTHDTLAALDGAPHAITADADALWVATANPWRIERVDLTSGQVTTLTDDAQDASRLTSAGDYLYASDSARLHRFAKTTGAWTLIAGNIPGGDQPHPGQVDGDGTDAWFTGVTALTSTGTDLLLTDDNNLRRVTQP